MDPNQSQQAAALAAILQQQQQQQQQQQNHQHLGQLQHPPQQMDAPQNVLAEARKNLQALIDSGISRDLLHQWVDDSQSLPVPSQPLASNHLAHHQNAQLQSQTSSQSPTPQSKQSHNQPQQAHAQQQSQHSPQQQSLQHQQQSQQQQSLPHPPPPQCAPPPPPSIRPVASNLSSNSTTPPGSIAPSTTPTINIKSEPLPEDASADWSSSSSTTTMGLPSNGNGNGINPNHIASMFMAPSAPFSHRPRISVSSTSSGSSGHASIWSTNSGQSSISWQSGSTCPRMQAPLPMPPPTSPPTGGPMLSAPHHAGSGVSKHNIYWCTSCETSFKRKYDWKRHEDEFHERWRKYPCPEPGCNRSFWGSNSFNQHHKQCHGCTTCPHAEKVVKFLRKRKYWACGFCSALHPARERHVEHVARHFESGMTKGDWMHSRVVYGLLHQPLIHEAWDALVNSKGGEYAGRRPQFSWHPSKTGRAQGFLENENPGQLQDLLEFFSGDEGEAQWIVSVAYDLADIVLTSGPVPPYGPNSMDPQAFAPTPAVQGARAVSFSSIPSQVSHQSMMPSDPTQHQFQAFRNTMFVPSQTFPAAQQNQSTQPQQQQQQQQSPTKSTSQSPLTASHSPMNQSQSPLAASVASSLEKREQQTQQPTRTDMQGTEPMMEFEYSPAPVVFEDWESLNSHMMDDSTPQPMSHQAQPDWGLPQYFGEHQVPS